MDFKQRYLLWCEKVDDKAIKDQLLAMKDDENKIQDCFFKDLEFGTAGQRGILGAGTNCLNIYTVGKTTQGLADYLSAIGGKKVFLEDIKGKRSYWKNTVNKGKWGRRTFHKMNKLSADLIQDKTTVILSPFTFVYGVVLGTVSTATSPIVSLFCKGGSVYIPANTPFKIKLTQDVKLYY